MPRADAPLEASGLLDVSVGLAPGASPAASPGVAPASGLTWRNGGADAPTGSADSPDARQNELQNEHSHNEHSDGAESDTPGGTPGGTRRYEDAVLRIVHESLQRFGPRGEAASRLLDRAAARAPGTAAPLLAEVRRRMREADEQEIKKAILLQSRGKASDQDGMITEIMCRDAHHTACAIIHHYIITDPNRQCISSEGMMGQKRCGNAFFFSNSCSAF